MGLRISRGTISLLTTVLLVWLGTTSLPGSAGDKAPSELGSRGTIGAIELEEVRGPCPDHCVMCADSKAHACHEDAGTGGDFCQHAEECTELGSCGDHACDPDVTRSDLDRNRDLDVRAAITRIPFSTAEEIAGFVRANDHSVRYNSQRGVIQILGCEDRIVAQAKVSPSVGRVLDAVD